MKKSTGSSTMLPPHTHRKQRLLAPVILLLLVGLSCAIPNREAIPLLGQATPAAAEPTAAAPGLLQKTPDKAPASGLAGGLAVTPTALSNLPPALVEVDPPPNVEMAPNSAPVFYFNQPMERASVEAALKVEPAQPITLDWVNDSTLRFTQDKNAGSTANGLSITIAATARAANGLTLQAPVAVSYPPVGPLRMAERLPKPDSQEINPTSAVVVTFNRPVVALSADSSAQPAAFQLNPAVNGKGEWLNTSTYIFYPQPALMGGTRYTVQVDPNLTSTDGGSLATDGELNWSFTTAAPMLLSVKPGTEQPLPLDTPIGLVFNQPMDRASVESSFSFTQADGSAVQGAVTWNEQSTEMTFKPNGLLERGANYNLVVAGSAASLGGATIGQDFSALLVSVPQFAIRTTNPAAGETLNAYSGYGTINLMFSSPVAADQDIDKLISISPPVVDMSTYRDPNTYQVFIYGYFQPSTSYTVTVAADLRDVWGATLGLPYAFTFSSQPARLSLVIPVRQGGSQALFVPQNETVIPARATNLTSLSLARGALSLNDFILADQDWQVLQNSQAKIDQEWSVSLQMPANSNQAVDIPITPDRSTLRPGLYLLRMDVQPATEDINKSPALLVVGPIQMVFKISAHQAFVWAVRTDNQQPAADQNISIYDGTAALIANCTTDASGTCQADLPTRDEPAKTLFAVLGQPGADDFSLASSDWYQGIGPWEFRVAFQMEENKPEVYLYTDRPIYQPGQSINFRAVVRKKDNARYFEPPLKQVTIEVVSPYDPVTGQSQVLATLPMPLDSFGTAAGAYSIPDDARTGTYYLRVQEVKFKEVAFEVAEYRKPEIDLQVKWAKPDELTGKDLNAQVTARYFFGAPAGNLTARWTVTRQGDYLDLPDGFTTGVIDTSWMDAFGPYLSSDIFVLSGEETVKPDGTLNINIPGQDLQSRLGTASSSLLDLKLEVTVEDASGLPVSARDTMRLHPSPYYIGVRAESWSGQTGQEMTYTIRSVDWQGAPAADKALSARFRKVVWKQKESTDPISPPSYTPEYTEIGSTDFRTSEKGEARLAFTPNEPGTFMLEVSGEDGALTQVLSWVGGSGAVAWPNLTNQHILLRSDADAYKPGQTAHVFIPNPFDGSTLALITYERAKVMHSSVVTINEASYDLKIPLTDDEAPNIYVSVTLLGRSNGRPDFRMGVINLDVAPVSQVLQVEVQSDTPEPQPGGDLTINLRVKDSQGKPVQGEFSLALIDKAVLALANPNTPDIIEAFYGKQPLGVQSSMSLAAYTGRFLYTPPGRGGGGGGDMATASVRSKFEDTAYWNGSIQTDVTGVATITLKLPDNLTTWRADVRGVTTTTQVGQAETDLTVGKPLLIRPVTPRFVVAGDHMEIAAVVHNNTQGALKISARLEGAGFTLDDINQAVQPVELQAGEQRRVIWWGTAQNVDAMDLTFTAESGSLRDSTRPEGGPIPVRQYSAPQTFGTAGMLAKAGETLEIVSLPRSFQPTSGSLQLQVSPSLTAVVFEGLKALEAYPHDFTEPVLSRLLPNLATYQALQGLKINDAALRTQLENAIQDSLNRLLRLQNEDGGWGWAGGYRSDAYISSYALLTLSRAVDAGYSVDAAVLEKAQTYLLTAQNAPTTETLPWQLDRLALQVYALHSSGRTDQDLNPLYSFREKLSPWGKAFLALTLDGQSPGDERARTLLSDLESSAIRSASGANWQEASRNWYNWSTANYTTAVVTYAIAKMDPQAALLNDAVRYLVLNRRPQGGWSTSFESAWALTALVESAQSSGDLQADYTYSAQINDSPLLNGTVSSVGQAAQPVTSTVPLTGMRADAPNALKIERGAGSGRLYYRAYLEVSRPAQDAPAVNKGLSITRSYYRAGQDCRKVTCQPLDSIDLQDSQPVQVRLTLTVPQDMYYVVVEDAIPAGAEVLNLRLKTSQETVVPTDGLPAEQSTPYDLANPFDQGWGWWLFNDPQVYDDHVRWVVEALPAGTYELTYRLTPYLAGEFRLIPAHAWAYYFPEVEGSSAGSILTIK